MIDIDGSQKSGSGTILRLAVALAAVLGEPLHVFNIRQKRPQSGLRPQHLEAVLTAARLCEAELRGAEIGSRELWFKPGTIKGGKFESQIGTAGSIPMLLMTVLPICLFAENKIQLHVSNGGTDVSNSPTINYLRHVLLSVLERMGAHVSLNVHRYGYFPKGMGEVTLTTEPCRKLKPLKLERFGENLTVKGSSVCTFLAERRVAERQAVAAENYLREKDISADIKVTNDESNPLQKGSSVVLWAETDTGTILGADAIGEVRKTSEAVGKEAAERLYAEVFACPTVDVHLADMLIPYAALSENRSMYLTRALSDHLETNIWLAQRILGVKFNVEKMSTLYRIEKTEKISQDEDNLAIAGRQ